MVQRISELTEILAATSVEPTLRSAIPVTQKDAQTVAPVITIGEERRLQVSLTEKLMQNAERSRPWVLTGIDL